MEKIYHIHYVDAYYTYEEKLGETKLLPHEAYGYLEKHNDNIVIAFIKKKGKSLKEIIRENENIIEGLVIPDTALLSKAQMCDQAVLSKVQEGMKVAVTWRDVVSVANLPRYDCAIMYTEGVLYKIEKDHVVLKDTETIRVHPMPVKNHPAGKPLWYIIPISFIRDIEAIS